MEKCSCGGKTIFSFEVAENYDYEKQIRLCRSLTCCDPDCNAPVIYKHGAIRRPYFAHANSADICRYDRSERNNSELFRKLREMVFLCLKNRYGDAADMDVMIIEGHYTPVSVCLDNARFAIDIADRRISAGILSERKAAYSSLGYTGLIISADEAFDCDIYEREDIYFPLKFQLNESADNTAVAIDRKTLQPCYMKLLKSDNSWGNVLSRFFELDELSLSDKGFSVSRLDDEFQKIIAERERSAAERRVRKTNSVMPVKPVIASAPITPFHRKAAVRSFDPYENYMKTGYFSDLDNDGGYIMLSLEDIKLDRNTPNYFLHFSDDEIQNTVNSAFDGTVKSVRTLMLKLFYADEKEREAFVRVYEELLNSDGNEDAAERIRLLEYAFAETGFFE